MRFESTEFILVPSCTCVLVVDSATGQTIDTLTGHSTPIVTLDGSRRTGIVVSVSQQDICFHVPTQLKWALTFKTKMVGAIHVARMSEIGDFCVFGGNQFISLWTQDLSRDSFTQQIFYSKDHALVAQQLGQVVEKFDGLDSQVVQIEILDDGRLFVTLQANSRHVKVWHQTKVWQQSCVEARRFNFDELDVNETEPTSLEIKEFKLCQRKSATAEACCLLTCTRLQVQLLVESLSEPSMRFVCIKTIRLSPRLREATIMFLPQGPGFTDVPVKDHELSKIFDTHRNEELKSKQSQCVNFTSKLQPGHAQLSLVSFCLIEDSNTVSLFRVRGITNCPQRNYEVEFIQKVVSQLPVTFSKVIDASVLHAPDHIQLVTENSLGHIHLLQLQNNELQFKSTFFANKTPILMSREHPSLDLLALVHSDSVVVLQRNKLLARFGIDQVVDLQWVPSTNALLVMHANQVTLFKYVSGVYEKQFTMNSSGVALCVNSFDAHHGNELQFTTIQHQGFTTHEFKQKQLTQVNEYSFGLKDNETSRVIAAQFYSNAGYLLLFTELLLPGRSGKVRQFLRLINMNAQTELFQQEVSVLHQVEAKFYDDMLIIKLVQGEFHKYKHVLNFYSLKDERFVGFLRISDALSITVMQGEAVVPMDFKLQDRCLTVVADGSISLLELHHGRWELQTKQPFEQFTRYDLYRSQIVIDKRYLVECPKLDSVLIASLPVFHPETLKTLFFKGYSKQVCQIVLELQSHITDRSNLVPDMSRIQFAQVVVPPVKKPFNQFSDFDESGSESEEQQPQVEVVDVYTQFQTKFDSIIDTLCSDQNTVLSKGLTLEIVQFLYQFRPLCKMDFYCDKLATNLLLHVFLQTEKVSEAQINGAKIDLGLIEGVRANKEQDMFNMESFIAQKMGNAGQQSQIDNSKVEAWTSVQVCMALYSENQDVILDTLSQRLDFPSSLTWATMRKLGIPLWLKSEAKLKQLIEMVAKNEYRNFENDGHQSKAEYAALWYVLTNKVQVIKQLFNVEPDGKKFADFLANDFANQPKPRSIACKNAMALVSKRKNLLACSFYLLGQDLAGAVQVAIERSRDPLLALLMCRLTDPASTNQVARLLISKGVEFNDPYYKSLGQWYLAEYVQAANSLTPVAISSADQLFKNVKKFDLLDSSVTEVILQSDDYPLLAKSSYESIELLTRLRKVPEVKRLLNKDWQLDKKSKMGAGMFDDLMGSDSEEEPVEIVKELITASEQEILRFVAQDLLDLGQTNIVQLLTKENPSLDLGHSITRALQHQQLTDLILQPTLTAELLHMSQVDSSFICRQLQQQKLYKIEMEYLVRSGIPHVQQRIEQESSQVFQFIQTSSMYCGQLLQADDRSPKGSLQLLTILDKIQEITLTMTPEFMNVQPWPQVQALQQPEHDSDSENIDCDESSPNKTPIVTTHPRTTSMTLEFKCKMGVILSLALFQMCLLIGKFSEMANITKEFTQAMTLWNHSAERSVSSDRVRFQSLFQIGQSIQKTIRKNINHSGHQRRKLNKPVEYQAAYDFVSSWFKQNCSQMLFDLLFQQGLQVLAANHLSDLVITLDQQTTAYDRQTRLATCDPSLRTQVLQCLQNYQQSENYDQKAFLDLRSFCKSNQRFKLFWLTFGCKQKLSSLQDMNLGHKDLQQNGIELFKQKGDSVTDFCVKGDMLALTLQAKGIREIKITCSLMFRTRVQTLDLGDEELLTWSDCLHRFDDYLLHSVEPSQPAIRQAILSHQGKQTMQNLVIQNRVQVGKQWDGRPESDYTAASSGMEITHEDVQSAIVAHPCLDVFLTGSAKGQVCLWQFNQQANRSLKQWVMEPEISIKDASKKAAVKKIQFTMFGDRFCSLNLEGSLFLHSFDLSTSAALFQIKTQKISDFDFVDEDATQIAVISQTNKCLSIVDCLTSEVIATQKVAGNLVKVDLLRRCIYSFNSKQGVVSKHDLNLGLVSTKTIHKEEATCCEWFGPRMQQLAVGFQDGVVKLFDLDQNEAWEAKTTINAFTSAGGKKGAVTSLKTHGESGALYGASSLGTVKLLKI